MNWRLNLESKERLISEQVPPQCEAGQTSSGPDVGLEFPGRALPATFTSPAVNGFQDKSLSSRGLFGVLGMGRRLRRTSGP